MTIFQYCAYGTRGEFAEGRIDAASPDMASQLLWAQGLTPFRMEPAQGSSDRWWQRELFSRSRTSLRELASFTREFATLMVADIPLDDALRILCDQGISERMTRTVKDLRSDILNGLALSDAMQKQGKVFSADYLNMVRAGEVGGHIAAVLSDLADLLERRAEMAARVRSALTYPALLLALAILSIGIIVGVLVPSVAGIFEESGRPLPSVLGLAMSLHARWPEFVLSLAIAAIAIVWGCRSAWSRPDMRQRVEHKLLKLPILGQFFLDQETGRFARVLGTLLKAGVPLLSASISARGVIRNHLLASGIDRAIDSIREGATLHRALQRETLLPPHALRMILVGEEAGKLEGMLTRVAVIFEQKTHRAAERFMTILTPLLTITMACIIGGLVMAVIDAVMSVNELAVQ